MIVIIMLILFVAAMYYSIRSDHDNAPNPYVAKEPEGNKAATDKAFEDTKSQSVKVYKIKEDPNYGGTYLDENGVMIINVVNLTTEIEEYMERNYGIRKDQYKLVQHSLMELESIMETLNPLMSQLSIVTLALSESDNKVNVYFKDITEDKMRAVQAIVNSDAIEFHNQEFDVVNF